nr:uncharacterized protein LOC102072978 [Zonotrichia albicollis]
MEQKRWVLLALALLLAIPFSGASQWVPASWIQLPLFLLTLAAGAVLVFQGRRVDSLETVWLKNHQHLYQKIQTLQEAFQNEQESTRCDIQLLKTDLENILGLRVEANTTKSLESMWKKDVHEVSQQVQTLQKAFQNTHLYTLRDLQIMRTDLKDELGRTVEANVTGNIAFMWQKDLLHLSQQIQTLKQTFQNMKLAIQRDFQIIRRELENKLGETMEAKTSTLEARLEKDHHEASQQIQTLQENFQKKYEATQRDFQRIRTELEHDLGKLGYSPASFHLSKEKSCSTGKQSCELILRTHLLKVVEEGESLHGKTVFYSVTLKHLQVEEPMTSPSLCSPARLGGISTASA